MKRAILVDTESKTLTEIECPKTYEEYCKILSCNDCNMTMITGRVACIFDSDASSKQGTELKGSFRVEVIEDGPFGRIETHYPILNNAIFVSVTEEGYKMIVERQPSVDELIGHLLPVDLSIAELNKIVRFQTLKDYLENPLRKFRIL